MPVHWESGTVFFHIPKCGGTSLEIMFSMMGEKSLWSENWKEYNFRGVDFAPQHLTLTLCSTSTRRPEVQVVVHYATSYQ